MVQQRLLWSIAAVVALQYVYLADATFLSGGSSGNNGTFFYVGTANTSKMTLGLTCTRPNSSSTELGVKLTAYENDPGFNHTGGGPLNNTLVQYTCGMLNVTAYRDDNMKIRQTATECMLTRNDASGNVTATDVDERTHATNFTFDSAAGPVPCGGLAMGTMFTYLMECYISAEFSRKWDFIAEFKCDNTTALITQLETNTNIGSPPIQNVTRRNYLEAKLWHVKNRTTVEPNDLLQFAPIVDQLELVTPATVLPLGAGLVAEFCLHINTTGDTRPYFTANKDILGFSVVNMDFINNNTFNPVQTGFTGMQRVITSRCGNATDPAPQLDGVATYYKQPQAPGTKWELISPNCFRTKLFETIAFATLGTGTTWQTIAVQGDYCSSTELNGTTNNCFGNTATVNNVLDGYVGCTRRKRSVEDGQDIIPEDNGAFPTDIEFTFLVDTGPVVDEIETGDGKERYTEPIKCFEKDTFSILTAVLALLLAVVLLMAVFLACRIQSARRDVKGGSSSNASFSNKGFY